MSDAERFGLIKEQYQGVLMVLVYKIINFLQIILYLKILEKIQRKKIFINPCGESDLKNGLLGLFRAVTR